MGLLDIFKKSHLKSDAERSSKAPEDLIDDASNNAQGIGPADASERLVFLDVETPNKKNDRVCGIGLVETRDGKEVERLRYSVDPEADFDSVNMSIHGITPADVAGEPTLDALWDNGLSVLLSSPIAGHNISFDVSVIRKALASYGIAWEPSKIICTKDMAQSAGLACKSYKLPHICEALGLPVDTHHDPLDDAVMCMRAYFAMRANGIPDPQPKGRSSVRSTYGKISPKQAEMLELRSILESAVHDGAITLDEAHKIKDYIKSSDALSSDAAMSLLADMIEDISKDGKVDEDESDQLLYAFSRILEPRESLDHIEYSERLFVLTGDFDHGPKSEVTAYIESRGGIVGKDTTMKTHYVVVGSQGSEAWAYGSYGTKVIKALRYQHKGKPVRIIGEDLLYC